MKKNILMVAYHYPPVSASSGVHRTLKFSQYLLGENWNPIVVTVHNRVFERVNDFQLKDIPDDVVVKRAFAVDTARHLTIKGKYFSWMALPDRWISWWLPGVFSGLLAIRKYKPKVIWSTYPIATAHLIALTLHKLTGIPWVADFRDSMTEDNYPATPTQWKMYRWIEKQALKSSRFAVFTTPGAVKMYRERYPNVDPEKIIKIENGFDEETFRAIANISPRPFREQLIFVHSGLLYPSERDPSQFFEALSELKKEQTLSSRNIKIILRASGHEDQYQEILIHWDINDMVFLEPPIPYGEALQEMLNSDGLLIFQAANCNHQIPAKVYEYIRAGIPVFAMTPQEGDTAFVLKEVGYKNIVPLDDKNAIKDGILDFIQQIKNNSVYLPSDQVKRSYSRYSRTQELVKILDRI